MRLIILFSLLSLFFCSSYAQFTYGTTGLLHAPTAEMNKDGTFMLGCSYLTEKATTNWPYNTYNYFINITIFPWLEVGYTCTLNKALFGSTYFPSSAWGKYSNQDRSFHIKLRIIKENQFYKWMPSVAIGLNDPASNAHLDGAYLGLNDNMNTPEGRLLRYYVSTSKHVAFENARLGIHLSFLYSPKRKRSFADIKTERMFLKSPAIGLDYKFDITNNSVINGLLNALNPILEYDGKRINGGMKCFLWKRNIIGTVEFLECKTKYTSVNLLFVLSLK